MNKIMNINEVLLASSTLSSDIVSTAFATKGLYKIGVIIGWSNLTGTLDAEYTLEVSNDGVKWGIFTPAVSITTASDVDPFTSADCFFNYVRLRVTKNNVTGGTVDASISLFQ